MLYIGIDLGTSACKFLLTDEKGSILNIVSEEYPLEFPQPGWSQQNPEDWWSAVVKEFRSSSTALMPGKSPESAAAARCTALWSSMTRTK